jgi:flagellar hook-basal body complex protein FliE
MNPLDALSAVTQVQAPALQGATSAFTPLPSGPANPVSETFNLLHPIEATPVAATPSVALNAVGGPSTWGHMVQQMVMDVNSKQVTAGQKINDVLQGGPTPVHEAMVASEEASLSFEFLSEMRNKVVDAYQQVMQMQV